MINKDRYNFDARFSTIAEKVLTLNGVIPGNIQDNNFSSKPTNFEQYQLQSDPDYQLLKQGNFMSEPTSLNQNMQLGVNYPISQPTIPMQQYQNPLSQSMVFNKNPARQPQNSNNYYSPQVKKKENIKEFVNNLNKDQLDMVLQQNLNFIKNGQEPMLINENLNPDQIGTQENDIEQEVQQPRQPLNRNASVPLVTGEMILQQQKMFEALQQQQFQFQQQLLLRQQEAEMERQRRKQKKQKEKELLQTLDPLIKNQQLLMEQVVKKLEDRQVVQPKNQYPKFQNFEDQYLMELEFRRKLAQQQHELQLQKIEQERVLQQQNLQMQSMMMPALMQFNPMNTNSMYGNPYAIPPNMMGNRLPNSLPPPPGSQFGQVSHAPKLGDMQSLLFNRPKSRGSVIIEGILRDMKK